MCGCGGGGSSASSSTTTNSPTATLGSLSGQYAFLLTGFDAGGSQMAVAGTIAADGNGHITGGAIDLNDSQALSSSGAVTGTYTSDSNHRGVISFTNSLGTVAHLLAFAFSLKTNGTTAEMIGFDANNFVITGTMQKQDPTAFSLSTLAGTFVYENDSHGPTQSSNIGRFVLAASGSATGIDDASLAGSTPLLPSNPFTATYATPGANGSSAWTVNENGITTNFVAFVISASKFIAVEMDTVGTIGATVATRQNAITAATLTNSTGSVFSLTGLDAPAGHTISAIGTLQVASSITGNFGWDTNDAGKPLTLQSVAATPLTFDPTTGRGTITISGGHTSGLFDSAVFYLSDVGTGFILDTGAGTNNSALAGPLQPQTGVGNFGNSSLSANMIGVGTTGDVASDALAEDILFAVSTTTTPPSLFGLEDVLAGGAGSSNLAFSGLAFSGINATTGRGVIATTTSSFVFYLIAPNQFVFITVASTGTISTRYFSVIPQ